MKGQSEIEKFIVDNWADISRLRDACDDFEKRIVNACSEEAFKPALAAELPGKWEISREAKGRCIYVRHPDFFKSKNDEWTCFEANSISLRSLLGIGDERPWVGLWWYSLRKVLSLEQAEDAEKSLRRLAEKKIGPHRRLGPSETNFPIWWYVDFDVRDPMRIDELPKLIVQEWKLLEPLVSDIVELSNGVRRRA